MERVELLHLIETCGDQGKNPSERWKDIVHVNISDDKTINSFKTKVKDGLVRFVDEAIGAGGDSGRLTGFYVLEYLAPDSEVSIEQPRPRISFISCKNIMSLTFANVDKDYKTVYNNLDDFITAKYKSATVTP